MPYKSIEELPAAVKEKLDTTEQRQWMSVFNAAMVKQDDEAEAAKQAWGAVKKKFSLPLEIFAAGTWNGDAYTEKDIEGIVHAFQMLKSEFLPRVKLGDHRQKFDIALGIVDNVWKSGKKLMGNISEMPRVVYDAVRNGLFKGVSSELLIDYSDDKGRKFPFALDGIAILGSNLPAVSNLADLTKYMSFEKQERSFKFIRTYSYEDKNKERRSNMVDIDQKELDKLKEDAQKAKTFEADLSKMKIENEERETETQRKSFTTKIEAFKTFCNEKVKEKILTPANRDMFFKELEAKTFSDESSIKEIDTLQKFVENQTKVFDTTPKGKMKDTQAPSDVAEEVHGMVVEYTAEHPKVGYEKAMSIVLMKDKELAKRYSNRPYDLPKQ